MVWSELVMWPPRLCSISLCRPSPNHDGNCRGQISHICWIMVTTIDWAQLALGEFLCVCCCDRAHACVPVDFWMIVLWMKLACMQSSVSIVACFGTPADICTMQHSLVCVHFRIDSLSEGSRWHFLRLLWHSWWGRKRREGILPTNVEKRESFSVMLFQLSLPPRHTCLSSRSTFDWWLLLLSALVPVIF